MDALERVDDRELRLGAEKHRGVAVGHVEIDEERAMLHRRQRGGDVDRHRGRADAALGADEGEQLPGDVGGFLRRETDDRRFERLGGQRLGEALADAGPHRVEDERRIERRRDEHQRGRRMTAPETGEVVRQPIVGADIDDGELERPRAGRERGEIGDAQGQHAQARWPRQFRRARDRPS